jgi:peptidoglycan-associated lipoprotein
MFKTLSLTLVAATALAACSSTPLEVPTQAPVVNATMAPANTAAPSTAQSTVATVTLDPLDDPKGSLAARSVFFAYDDFAVDSKYQPLVQAHGQFLQSRPQVQIRVEGNTDERGSREYNLALGDKRAQVVAKQLELMGAKAAQIEAVSYGEERPKSEGHDEAAYSENRRADIRYVKR